jgi:hypothetical protein
MNILLNISILVIIFLCGYTAGFRKGFNEAKFLVDKKQDHEQ